ncbi:MAG: hypothetical protein RPU34_17030 [Candidatus Sedimenticola sp. (ex Thyasira tokunagai)]
MRIIKQLFAVVLISMMTFSVRADVLVLVHGYLGSAHSWETSGVNAVLNANGWPRAGMLTAGPAGVQLLPATITATEGNAVYAVELPSLAPMMIQADYLQVMLQQIAARHPGESTHIAAHSAGGVVARIALVRGAAVNAKSLITISSPHLGTERAVQALDASDTSFPFCLVEDFFSGGKVSLLKNSRGALIDLTPAYPGSLLHWLNSQPHPDIAYYSVIRPGPVGMGDELIPAFSQDMNNIPALKGRSQVSIVATGHMLNPQDGMALVSVLPAL